MGGKEYKGVDSRTSNGSARERERETESFDLIRVL